MRHIAEVSACTPPVFIGMGIVGLVMDTASRGRVGCIGKPQLATLVAA